MNVASSSAAPARAFAPPEAPTSAAVSARAADLRVQLFTDAEDAARAGYARFWQAAGGHFEQGLPYAAIARATSGPWQRPRWALVLDRRSDVVAVAQLLRAHAGPLPLPLVRCARGPVVRSPDDVAPVCLALARRVRRAGVARLSVMPYVAGEAQVASVRHALSTAGFRARPDVHGPHTWTLRFDLSAARDELFAGPVHRGLRQVMSLARRAGVTVREGTATDLPILARLHTALMAAQGRRARPQPAWEATAENLRALQARLWLVWHADDVIGAALTVAHGSQVTLTHAATVTSPRRFSKLVLGVAAAIVGAHEQGATLFDLGGIPAPDDTDAKRLAIAQFKREFSRTPLPLLEEHTR